ncbi:MAG: radical SAM protein [Planctomycetes bacterium]|nr:radical SAM protein [Planctomycetota bacterium]
MRVSMEARGVLENKKSRTIKLHLLPTYNSRYFAIIPQTTRIFEISPEIIQGNVNADLTEKISDELHTLQKLGFLCECSPVKNETELEGIRMHIAHACNLRCKYCDVNQGQYSGSGFMPASTARKTVDFLVSKSSSSELKIIFWGGEPLLNFSVITDTINYAKSRYPEIRFSYQIHTNGTLINREMMETLRNNRISMTISLDGYRQLHDKNRVDPHDNGTWDKISDNIQLLNRHNITTNISCIITEQTNIEPASIYKQLKDHFPFVKNISVKYEKSYINSTSGELTQNLIELDKTTEEYVSGTGRIKTPKSIVSMLVSRMLKGYADDISCPHGSKWVSVLPNGNIYLCHHSAMGNNPEFLAGNIETLFNSTKLNNIINGTSSKCRDCFALNLCNNRGCHLSRVIRKEPLAWQCDLTFAQINEILEYLSSNTFEEVLGKFISKTDLETLLSATLLRQRLHYIKPLAVRGCNKCGGNKDQFAQIEFAGTNSTIKI